MTEKINKRIVIYYQTLIDLTPLIELICKDLIKLI